VLHNFDNEAYLGKRVLRGPYFNRSLYRSEKAVRQKVESQILKLNEDTEYARAKGCQG
jgi:hypothetical protein